MIEIKDDSGCRWVGWPYMDSSLATDEVGRSRHSCSVMWETSTN
jgi:hypothetical protein